jgi:pimeloyl-ACP methyl ester carboxylesterase
LVPIVALILLALGSSSSAQSQLSSYVGNYQVGPGHIIGIDLFGERGEPGLLYSDYLTGAIRSLSPKGDGFVAGRGFAFTEPVDLTVRFANDGTGISTLLVGPTGKPPFRARRLPIASTDVTFSSGDATLAGTLLVPSSTSPAPHAAIVLLHGSGPLTRYSFGPYPHFFTSLGLAVLVYDKRGSGASTGRYFDGTTHYPDAYGADAVEAVRFLASRPEVDPAHIGLWGTSEGGMLTTQVAARSKDVAFIINSSGFMVPMAQQVMFNIEAQLRADGFSANDVDDAVRFESLAMRVMRTGDGWNEFSSAQTKARQAKWWTAYFGQARGFDSLDALRRQWDLIYSFDPLPNLANVKVPVLGVFGSLDTSTPARTSAENMQRILTDSGNRNVTVRVFKGANHPLMRARTGGIAEMPRLGQMMPGVFNTIRSWIQKTIGASTTL